MRVFTYQDPYENIGGIYNVNDQKIVRPAKNESSTSSRRRKPTREASGCRPAAQQLNSSEGECGNAERGESSNSACPSNAVGSGQSG
jgi:hypothetical protein